MINLSSVSKKIQTFNYMTLELLPQTMVFVVIVATITLLIWNKFRYDLVAVLAVLILILTETLALEEALGNFGHPVIFIVGAMFILSRSVTNSGLIEIITRKITFLQSHIALQILTLASITALASAFINNLGALALMMPIAIHMAHKSKRSPALYLIPLAFSSHLGGFLTLIGTPRNLIVSSFREEATGQNFGFFDFGLVGLPLAVLGLIFLSTIGWRFFKDIKNKDSESLQSINYVTEVYVPTDSVLIGQPLNSIKPKADADSQLGFISIIRSRTTIPFLSGLEIIEPEDTLLIEADPETLNDIVETNHLVLTGEKAIEDSFSPGDEKSTLEAIVSPGSALTGQSWGDIPLKLKFGVNLLAIARYGEKIGSKINETRIHTGDIILFSGRQQSVQDTITKLGCYPLAERPLLLGRKLTIPLTLTIFILTIVVASTNLLPLALTFLSSAIIVLLLNLVSIKQAYQAIEWPILITIGSMLSIGTALKETGGSETIAVFLTQISEFIALISRVNMIDPALIILAVVLITAILLSDFINSTSSAVIMSPIAISLAASLGISPDPLLMAVAIGASCAFLTPTGHESNTLVMETGGYKTTDYIKIGLPLEILIVITSLLLIPVFWPL